MMLLLCSSNGLQAALTTSVYVLVVLSTCSTEECGLQLTEKITNRSVVFRNVEKMSCQTTCFEESFIFASCRQSSGELKKIEKPDGSSVRPEKGPRVSHDNVTSSGELKKIEKTDGTSVPPVKRPRVPTKSCGSVVCSDTSQCLDKGCEKVCTRVPSLCDLHTASETGDLSRVKFVLSQGREDVNCQEWIGRTPVMWAAGRGHREVVELLVRKGAKLSLVDRYGIKILHSACMGGDVEVVKYVLSQRKVHINDKVHCGRTAVMLAGQNGHKEVVELLIKYRANLSFRDNRDNNILHLACLEGHLDVVEYIISLHTLGINSGGFERKTPAMLAGSGGHKEVVEFLVNHGANLALRNSDTNTILHLTSYGGSVEVMKYVLSQNAVDVNGRGWKRRTAVMIAGQKGRKGLVELFVKYGANLSLKDRVGENTLHLASNGGHLDVVKYILSLRTVDIDAKNNKWQTALMKARMNRHRDVVDLLVSYGART